MPPRFLLQTFGGLTLSARDGEEAVFANQRKRLAFIAALAADANGGVSRDRLFALFWPESDGERARNALNQLVFAIRRDLVDDAILTDTVTIRLNTAVVDSDLRIFRDAFASQRFADAIETYRGPFLDGVFLRDAPEFERRVDDLRRALALDYARALEREIDAALSVGPDRASDALRYARLLVVHDPLSTTGALRLMRALERSGDTSSALRHAALHAAHVGAELESEPGPELEREVARLRAGQRRGSSPAETDARNGDRPTTPSSSNVTHEATAQLGSTPPADTAPPAATAWRANGSRRRRPLWVGVGAVVIAAAVAIALFVKTRLQDASDSPDSSRVLVAALTNRTGDSTLDYIGYIAADWVTQGLSQSEIIKVVYGPTAFELSRSAPAGRARSEADRVRLLSARSGAGTVISGSYYLVRDSIVISAEVTDGRSGRVLRTVPPIAASKSDPMQAVQSLRERSVGALVSVVDPRLASLSGSSSPPPLMEAYRAYLEGLELFRQGQRPKVSLARFLVAAHRDSNFMLPVIWAVWMAGYARQMHIRDSLLQVLEAHRNRLALIDRYALDFEKIALDSSVPPPQRLAAVDRIVKLAPASNWSWIEAGCLYSAGNAKQAFELLEHIDPEHGWAGAWSPYWVLLSNVQHSLGEYEAQLRSAERSRVLGAKLGVERGLAQATEALVGLQRTDSALALVREAMSMWSKEVGTDFLAGVATELRAHGQRATGDSLTRAALERYRALARNSSPGGGAGLTGFRLSYLDFALQAEALRDAKATAEAMLSDSLGMQDDPDESLLWAHGALGVVAAYSGDRSGALAEIRQMPDLPRLNRQMRWASGKVKSLVAGALHDRQLAFQYLAEMESQGAQGLQDAATVALHYPELNWLAHDPRIRLPYVGGAAWAAPVATGSVPSRVVRRDLATVTQGRQESGRRVANPLDLIAQ